MKQTIPFFWSCLILFFTLGCILFTVVINIIQSFLSGNNKKNTILLSYTLPTEFQTAYSIATSIFISGTGAWILATLPETGVLGGYLGVLGYSISVWLPVVLVAYIGVNVKEALGNHCRCFTFVSFLQKRYGRFLQIIFSLNCIFFSFMLQAAELTSLGIIFQSLSQDTPKILPILAVALVTLFYTVIGGTSSIFLTNKIQCLLLFCIGGFCLFLSTFNVVKQLGFHTVVKASTLKVESVYAFITLVTSISISQMLDQSMWLKVFASKTSKDTYKGFILGGFFLFVNIFLFGFLGIVASAANSFQLINIEEGKESYAFYLLLENVPVSCLGVILLFSVMLVASTVDSQQIAVTQIIEEEVLQTKNYKAMSGISGAVSIVVTCFSVIVAWRFNSVLSLFMTANLIGVAFVPTYMLVFWTKTTTLSVTVALIAGHLSIPITGWILTNSFKEGLLWFQVPYSLFHFKTMVTFILVPFISLISLIIASIVHCYLDPSVEEKQKQRFNAMKQVIIEDT